MMRRRLDDESGITLIELLVYSILGVGVLLIVGSILINGLRGQASVTAITGATNSGQLAASSIQGDIRNSSRLKVHEIGDDQFVQARVARGTSSTVAYRCVAWYYSASTQEIRSTTSGSRIATPSAAELANWRLVASGVAADSDTDVVFSGTSSQLELTFTVNAGSAEPVTINSSATSRNPNSEDTPPCIS